jgi:hypothetical protein
MMNTLLFAANTVSRVPSDFSRELPKGWKGSIVRSAILAHHLNLEPVFEKGVGMSLMFTESQILVAVLLRLMDEGIVTLPMHDGVMAPVSKAERVRRIMEDVAEEKTGFRLPVAEKGLKALRVL